MTLSSKNIGDNIAERFEEMFDFEFKKEQKTKRLTIIPQNMEILEKEYGKAGDRLKLSVAKCDGCLNAFVRGVFVGCGTMNDPKGEHHLELAISAPMADELLALLGGEDVAMKKTTRNGKTLLYLGSGDMIQDFLTYIGAVKFSLDMIQARVTKERLQYASRRSNFDYANIKKTTVAATTQVDAVKYLSDTGLLARLSPELIETAKLRLEYPTATLDELRQKIDPPISKSGLNHRLGRLVTEAEAAMNSKK